VTKTSWLGLALCAAVTVLQPACSTNPPLDTANVDLSRFQGKWYEIAKLPRVTQAGCVGTTAFYRMTSATEIDVVNECTKDGLRTSVPAKAVVPDTSSPGKLSLDVGGFFGDYWITEVGDTYEYAVIGHPSRDYLWILSRTPKLDPAKLTSILDHVKKQQFDVSRLEYTPQP
jgi:apolipoprotein D and lipocalin family protein